MRFGSRAAGPPFAAYDLPSYVDSDESGLGGGKEAGTVDVVPPRRDRPPRIRPRPARESLTAAWSHFRQQPVCFQDFPRNSFNSKISTLVPRYPSDSKRSGGRDQLCRYRCSEDYEEQYEEDEASAPVEAKPQNFGEDEDKEWTAEEPIPDIDAQAQAGEKSEQIIPQIEAVASVSVRLHGTHSPGSQRPGGLSHADRNSAAQWASVPRYPPL